MHGGQVWLLLNRRFLGVEGSGRLFHRVRLTGKGVEDRLDGRVGRYHSQAHRRSNR